MYCHVCQLTIYLLVYTTLLEVLNWLYLLSVRYEVQSFSLEYLFLSHQCTTNMYIVTHNWNTRAIYILAEFKIYHIVINIEMIKKKEFNITTSKIIHTKNKLKQYLLIDILNRVYTFVVKQKVNKLRYWNRQLGLVKVF